MKKFFNSKRCGKIADVTAVTTVALIICMAFLGIMPVTRDYSSICAIGATFGAMVFFLLIFFTPKSDPYTG